MQFTDFPEMMTIDGKGDRQGQHLRINLSACLKLQDVSGNDGYISNVFMVLLAYPGVSGIKMCDGLRLAE
jgi:hypothetical protein